MNHSEAIQEMATERYLLDELSPELRDAFEEHFFDCPECALDLRAAAAFVEEAKVQLPGLTQMPTAKPAAKAARPAAVKKPWYGIFETMFLRPAFAAPAFAALLAVVGYQNLVTYPALRAEASQPYLAPTVFLHSGSRAAGTPTVVEVDRRQGAALLVDPPQQKGYALFLYELRDAQGTLADSLTVPAEEAGAESTMSFGIRSAGLRNGAYTLVVFGQGEHGERTEIDRHALEFHFRN